jgi:hypothetical protein
MNKLAQRIPALPLVVCQFDVYEFRHREIEAHVRVDNRKRSSDLPLFNLLGLPFYLDDVI